MRRVTRKPKGEDPREPEHCEPPARALAGLCLGAGLSAKDAEEGAVGVATAA